MEYSAYIDVRLPEEFEAARLACAVPGLALNVPLVTLADRWFELPPPQTMSAWLWIVRDAKQRAELDTAVLVRFDGPPPVPINVLVDG